MNFRGKRFFQQGNIVATGTSVIIITVAVKIFDAVKHLFSVSRFGITAQADIYNIIITIPEFVVVAIGLDTIRAAATTYFTEYVAKNDKDSSDVLFSSLFTWGLVASLLLGIVTCCFMKQLVGTIASGFTGDKMEETISLAYIIIPVLVLRGITGIFISLLYAHNRFKLSASLSAITTICVIVALVISNTEYLARNIAIAYTIGFCLYAACLVISTKKYVHWHLSFSIHFLPFREVIKMSVNLIVCMVITQIAIIVEKKTASYFPDGTLAALGVANTMAGQFVFLVFALFGVMQRRFITKISQNDVSAAIGDLWKILSYLLFGVVFIALILNVLGEPILRVIYKRGSFDEIAVNKTLGPLMFYSLWIIGQTISLTITPFLLAAKHSKVFIIASIIAYGFDIAFVGEFATRYGYVGIAFTSFLTITMYSIILLICMRLIYGRKALNGAVNILKILCIGLLIYAILLFLVDKFPVIPLPQLEYDLLKIVVVSIIGLLLYLLLSSMLNVNYLRSFWLGYINKKSNGVSN